jgi:lipopolysaccharide/colanic/teichoic acid biosynthesis glycosyltransferase
MFAIMLFFSDLLVFIASIFLAVSLRALHFDAYYCVNNLITFAPLLLPVVLSSYIFSFYDVKFLRKPGLKKTAFYLFCVNIAIALSFFYLFAGFLNIYTPKTNLLLSFFFYFLFAYALRKTYVKLKNSGVAPRKNILIIGAGETLNEIRAELYKHNEYNALSSDKDSENGDVDLVVVPYVSLFDSGLKFWNYLAGEFINKGVVVKTDFDFYEELYGRISHESAKYSLWVLKTVGAREQNDIYISIKRLFDVFFSLTGAIICIIPFVLIWFVIKFFYGYAPIFKQKRVGYLGKKFFIYKFITMRPKEKDSGDIFGEYRKEKNDYFAFGTFLRRFRLDELPQLINILKGDLSFVGPRPVWDKEYEIAEKEIPDYAVRNIVRPGIAGWAQLNFRAVRNISDCVTRFSYDIYYIKKMSLFLDSAIILKTIKRVLVSDKKMQKI